MSSDKMESKMPSNNLKLNLKKVADQVIVITGASSGIGLVTARMAAAKGAKVVAAARNEEALKKLVDELTAKGQTAIYVTADVSKEEDVDRIAEKAIEEFDHFDTWVNNAGVAIYGHGTEISIPDMKQMFETDFWGTVYGSRAAAKHFKDTRTPSAIINVGSVFGDKSSVMQSIYATSKFAVHGWTDSIRMVFEKEHLPISVTLIHPYKTDTPYTEHAHSYIPNQPSHLGIVYPPEAVAEAILFAAQKPKRDMYVGGMSKLTAVLNDFFPRFTDRFVEEVVYPSQYRDRPSKPQDESSLYKAGYGLHERGTNKGWIRKRSYYVKAQKHPVLTTVAITSIAVLGLKLFKCKK
ncbi:SDR family oxidoreductase [Desemzia sp. FAM 23991]|uniref:SDR family oxidoreductase n=1 Tax=unclassified Desemzia TaxID=2685243 RepID=UPI0038878592